MNPVMEHGLVRVGITVPVNRKSLFELPRRWTGVYGVYEFINNAFVPLVEACQAGMTLKRRENSRLILKLSGVWGRVVPLFNKGC